MNLVRRALSLGPALARQLGRDERRPLLALLALLALVAGSWSFLEIADEVLERDTHAMDVWLLRALRDPADPARLRGPDWLAEAARDVTALGSSAVLALFTATAVLYLWLKRMRAGALLALFTVLGAVLIFSALKQGFARERPFEVPALVEETARSFPSGHSTMAAVVYLSLAVVLAALEPQLAVRGYLIAVGAAIAFGVGLSRVALGVHYPSDVLAGWAVGLAWAAACWLLLIWLQRRDRTPGTRSGPDLQRGGSAQR